ncbi:hypothetical protein BB560_005365 [Smittium megazygosporum]|uniref:Uncharacterized protein n=1 Tax=Smittium megazygosporum TaxID=133381 RepID=A0A2T9Z6N9_9FUNG|nr:hypothetical protein BB560_005365 [Smittium megazygosporum]
MNRLLERWTLASERNPIKVVSITNAIICALGDFVCQKLQFSSSGGSFSVSLSTAEYDVLRTLRFASWGCILGPVLNKWYIYLNRHFPMPKAPSLKTAEASAKVKAAASSANYQRTEFAKALFKRVAADQLAFAPFGVAGFFVYMNLTEPGHPVSLSTVFREKYLETLKSNYYIWPAFQFVNFSVVPIQFRVPVGSMFGILWNVYLSYMHAR